MTMMAAAINIIKYNCFEVGHAFIFTLGLKVVKIQILIPYVVLRITIKI
jgi:hypothetical protein